MTMSITQERKTTLIEEFATAVGAVSDQEAVGLPAVIPDNARVAHVNVAEGEPGVPVDEDAYSLRVMNLGAGGPVGPGPPVAPSYPLAWVTVQPLFEKFPVPSV